MKDPLIQYALDSITFELEGLEVSQIIDISQVLGEGVRDTNSSINSQASFPVNRLAFTGLTGVSPNSDDKQHSELITTWIETHDNESLRAWL